MGTPGGDEHDGEDGSQDDGSVRRHGWQQGTWSHELFSPRQVARGRSQGFPQHCRLSGSILWPCLPSLETRGPRVSVKLATVVRTGKPRQAAGAFTATVGAAAPL